MILFVLKWIYTRNVIFIQLQEFPTPPYCCCCSVTKRSDNGITEALKALKMHFETPHNEIKCVLSTIVSYSIENNKFSHLLMVNRFIISVFYAFPYKVGEKCICRESRQTKPVCVSEADKMYTEASLTLWTYTDFSPKGGSTFGLSELELGLALLCRCKQYTPHSGAWC